MATVNNAALNVIKVNRAGWWKKWIALALCLMTQMALAETVEQKTFASPEEGVSALVDAVRTHNQAKMSEILGPKGDMLINSGDEVSDKKGRESFLKAYTQSHRLQIDSVKQVTLVIGNNGWPLPIPLVKTDKGWLFDTDQGDDEILARRIGRNELSAVQVMLEITDSQREYAALNRSEEGKPVYAARIISTPGKHDGLYWPTSGNEPVSPIGELLAAAADEGYAGDSSFQTAPYHGYLFRILSSQDKSAKGGAYDYVENGRMTRGFAAIGYPARYGASGVMTFMVNHDGQVFEKNLGSDTEKIAARMKAFDPDSSWRPVDAVVKTNPVR